jgi:hypothetical protein
MLSTQAATESAIVDMAVLHVFAQVGPDLGHFTAVRALVQFLAHLDDLRLDDLIDVLEERGV